MENDYVATAAAQKRLNEVLVVALEHHTEALVEEVSAALLSVAKIEYKARSKQVVISLDLPDTATIGNARDKLAETAADSGPAAAAPGVEIAPEGVTLPGPPQPHIGAYVPKQFAEPDYEDVHFD